MTEEELQRFWDGCRLEVLCLVEGIDPMTSATIQARHSYTRLDMAFHHDFAPCVSEDSTTGRCLIDFHRFHDLVPIMDAAGSGVEHDAGRQPASHA
jgi:hypothetical protein